MSDRVYVSTLPECDIHKYEQQTEGVPAAYDGKTSHGPWANMCQACFDQYGTGLGTGKGQRLIVGDEPERDVRAEVMAARRLVYRCVECRRGWFDDDDANEWAFGHDCEED